MTVLLESSADFSINRNEIINLAAEIAGVKGIGRVLSYEDLDRFSNLLNLIVKQWMGKSDFAPGLKIWTRKRAYLFPQLNDSQYTLGVDGDHATDSYTQTTLSAAEASGQTVLSVTSITGMTVGQYIGIRMTTGTFHWSTISTSGAGTVTIAAALSADASSGATVYFYTSKILYPLEMISIRRKDTDSNETPLSTMSLMDYEEGLLKKNDSGTPTRYLYERGTTDGTLFLDYLVSDTTEVYLLTYLRPIADFDASTDTPDYPMEWYKPLVGQLAMDIATTMGRPVTEEMKLFRDESLAIARNVDAEQNTDDVFFKCET